MNIAVLQDPNITPFDTYDAHDAVAALSAAHDVRAVSADVFATLARTEFDVAVLPYKDGELTPAQLDGLLAFHADGGGIVILGRIPHRLAWYPYRNSDAYRFRLALGSGPYSFSGLSEFGKKLFGRDDMPDIDFFAGKTISSLRVTAHPPDRADTLFETPVRDFAWHSTPAVCVTRYCDAFFGARLAAIPAHDGEPRENAAGAHQLDWEPAPTLLTREWRGIDLLVTRLAEWCRPAPYAVRIDCTPVHDTTADAPLGITVRSFADAPTPFLVHFEHDNGVEEMRGELPARGSVSAPVNLPPRSFGIHRYRATLFVSGDAATTHACDEFVLPADASAHSGYGFSTYWAFPDAKPVPEFTEFCREMKVRGCQYVRVNIPWEDIEPAPTRYDWTLPDALLGVARETGLLLRFWMFPTTRGSGLSDAGVPEWSYATEPAMTFDGHPGFFPTLWSEFYRTHYFGMVRAFARRYRNAPALDRMMVDFGNSDFPYGYFYYGGDDTIFDYSPQEQTAFRNFVRARFGDSPETERVTVPRPTDEKMWRVYLDFRHWSVRRGIAEVEAIIREEAPAKLSPDLPGHGAGSLADLSSFGLDAKKRHVREERVAESGLCALHNSGPSWGGEAWQVGARYAEYDDALFHSLRLNADYFSLPGVDLGVHGDDVARLGFIRRTIMGAERDTPRVAIYDRIEWNAWQSLAHVASRLDVEVDVLAPPHRHDFACYDLVVLPPEPFTEKGCLVPRDDAWWQRLRDAVEHGTNLLVFPGTVRADGLPLCRVFGLNEAMFGERKIRSVAWRESSGECCAVRAEGDAIARDADGEPVLLRRPLGRGAVWLAGFDTTPESLDGALCYERDSDYAGHTLARLLRHLGIAPSSVRSGDCCAWKSVVRRDGKSFLLVFSHREETFVQTFFVRSDSPLAVATDLATGERFEMSPDAAGWWRVTLPVQCRRGRYLATG